MIQNQILIQRLRANEISLFRKLNQLFAVCFEDPQNYLSNKPTDEYIAGLLKKETIIPIVATVDKEVVGGLVAYELEKFEQQRREIYIYDLAVDEQFRRRGIATKMIRYIRNLAKQRGAWVVYVQADYGDKPAVALYSKLGRGEDVMYFDIEP